MPVGTRPFGLAWLAGRLSSPRFDVLESQKSLAKTCVTESSRITLTYVPRGHAVCAGSTLLSQGLSAVTEEPPPAESSAAPAAAAAPGSPVIVDGEQGLHASGSQSPPAAVSASPASVDAAAAAWRGRAFNAAFQGSPTMSGCGDARVFTMVCMACQQGFTLAWVRMSTCGMRSATEMDVRVGSMIIMALTASTRAQEACL